MAAIFISHSSEDNEQAGRLKEWLGEIGFDQLFLDFDKHLGIPLGSDWETHLYREMERCQAVLLVLTSNWLESKWCFAEFAQARALGKTIYVVLETPQGETAIARDLQVCNLVVDPEGGKERLRLALQEALLVAQAGFALPPNRAPYPGLVSFAAEDAAVFFGRDGEINSIFEWVRSERSRRKKGLAILGGSGTGKSSLLKAGILPRLGRERDATGSVSFVVVPPVRPGDSPLRELLAALRTVDATLTLGDLSAATTPAAARDLVDRLCAAAGAPRAVLVVAVDQAEELFAAADREQADAFSALLVALAAGDTPARLLLTLRADHLEDIQRIEGLADAIEVLPIKPMPIERLSEIVKGPARRADLLVEDALVEAIKSDATSLDALPLVAFVLRELYDRYGRASRRLERVHYDAMRLGDLSPLEAAVRRKAEETIGGAAANDLVALREAFVPDLVRINEEGLYVRRAALRSTLPEAARPLVEKLIGARLLVENQDEHGARIEVAHEALFRVWPMLAGWLVEERDFLIGKSRIERLHEDYQRLPAAERDQGLLSGILLDRARGWLDRYPRRFTQEEGAFIRRSARQAAMRARVGRALFIAAIVLAMGLAASGIWAWQQRNAAVAARRDAEEQTRVAQTQRARADKDFAAAKQAIRSLVVDVAQGLADATGVPVSTIRSVLETVKTTVGDLTVAEPDDKGLQRIRLLMLGDFTDTYEKAGDQADATTSAGQGLAIARELAKDKGNVEAQRDLSKSLDDIAGVKNQAGDRLGALAAVQESLAITRGLAKDKGNAEAQHDLARSLGTVGYMELQSGDRLGGLAADEESLAIRRELVKQKATAEAQHDLSVSLDDIADAKLQAGDTEGALADAKESLAIARELAKDKTHTRSQGDLAFSLDELGDVKSQTGDSGGAIAAYQEGLAIRRELATDKGNADAQRALAGTLDRIAYAKQQAGDAEGARAANEESLVIVRELAKDKGDAGAQRDLGAAIQRTADGKMKAGDTVGALAAYQESLVIARELAKDKGNEDAQRALAGILDRIAIAKQQAGDTEGARAANEESLVIVRELAKDKGDAGAQRDLGAAIQRTADGKMKAGDTAGALAAYQESLAIFRELAKDKGNEDAQRNLLASLDRIAIAKQQADDTEGARAANEESLVIARELAKDKDNAEAQRNLATVLQRTADGKTKADDFSGALAAYQESLAIRRELATDKGNEDAQRDLAASLGKMREARWQVGDRDGALAAAEEQVAITRALYTADQTPAAKSNLAGALGGLSFALLCTNRPQDALDRAQEALALDPAMVRYAAFRAHALLFLGRVDEAKAIYLSDKDKPVGDGQTFAQAAKEDFAMFRQFGIDLPAMKEIEALLST